MRYYLVAGEASGDLHGSNLMLALKKADPQAEFRFWGGDLMSAAAEGIKPVSHYKDRAYMGFVDVLKNLGRIKKLLDFCKKDMIEWKPDAVIFIDYPGFNLRMARFAKEAGFKVLYYISPTIWAWKEGRVHTVRKYCDKMYCILPFEPAWYAKYKYDADYFGHPLMDAIAAFQPDASFRQHLGITEKPVIAVLPGSRKQELDKILRPMIALVPAFPEYHFVIAKVPSIPAEYYYEVAGTHDLVLAENRTYDLLSVSTAALVKSGTSTLEAALFNVPQVVGYKTAALNYAIASRLVKLDYVSLPNLIMNREIITELLQEELTPERIRRELKAILPGAERREHMFADYQALHNILGGAGASKKIATDIVTYLQKG